MLGHLVEVAVEVGQFGLHHLAAGRSPAGHEDDGLVPSAVDPQAHVLQLALQGLQGPHTPGSPPRGRYEP